MRFDVRRLVSEHDGYRMDVWWFREKEGGVANMKIALHHNMTLSAC